MSKTYEEEQEEGFDSLFYGGGGKRKDIKKTKYLVPPKTTHLMIWFRSALPSKREVQYRERKYEYETFRNEEKKAVCVDYVETLKRECEKMKKKGDACILVYDSEMLNDKDQEEKQLRDVVKDIPNCFLVDYEDFIKSVKEDTKEDTKEDAKSTKEFNKFIEETTKMIKSKAQVKGPDGVLMRGSLGDLVDCARIALLCKPGILKNLAIQKNENKNEGNLLNVNDFSLLYHDFDVIQNKDIDDKNKEFTEFPKGTSCIYFSSPEKCQCEFSIENGIIFANSIGNRNEEIEGMIAEYMNQPIDGFLVFPDSMYDVNKQLAKYANDFTAQFIEEGHRAWRIGVKEKTNNSKTSDVSKCHNSCNTNLKNKKKKQIRI